jgi:hypothetical protein
VTAHHPIVALALTGRDVQHAIGAGARQTAHMLISRRQPWA